MPATLLKSAFAVSASSTQTGSQTHGWVLVLLSEWKQQYRFSSKLQRFKLHPVMENILSQNNKWRMSVLQSANLNTVQILQVKSTTKQERCQWCTAGGAPSQVTSLFLASQDCPAKGTVPNLFMFQPGDSSTSVHQLSLLMQGWHKAHASLH